MLIVFHGGRVGELMKHYVCEVIQMSAVSVGLAGLIVSVLVLAGEVCETELPIVFQEKSGVGGNYFDRFASIRCPVVEAIPKTVS